VAGPGSRCGARRITGHGSGRRARSRARPGPAGPAARKPYPWPSRTGRPPGLVGRLDVRSTCP